MFWILVGLIGLHVAAILFYLLVRRDNLVAPMVTGRREAPAGEAPMIAGARLALPRSPPALAAGLTLCDRDRIVSCRSFSPCFTVLGS